MLIATLDRDDDDIGPWAWEDFDEITEYENELLNLYEEWAASHSKSSVMQFDELSVRAFRNWLHNPLRAFEGLRGPRTEVERAMLDEFHRQELIDGDSGGFYG